MVTTCASDRRNQHASNACRARRTPIRWTASSASRRAAPSSSCMEIRRTSTPAFRARCRPCAHAIRASAPLVDRESCIFHGTATTCDAAITRRRRSALRWQAPMAVERVVTPDPKEQPMTKTSSPTRRRVQFMASTFLASPRTPRTCRSSSSPRTGSAHRCPRPVTGWRAMDTLLGGLAFVLLMSAQVLAVIAVCARTGDFSEQFSLWAILARAE